MSAIIYLITNTLNNKQYVGLTTKDLEWRWMHHCSKARCGSSTYFHNAIRKYGPDAFRREVLEETTHDVISDRERHWITQLAPAYNTTSGGQDYFTLSDEIKAKISASMSGSCNPMYGKRGEDAPHYGHTHTSETRAKLADAARGNINRRGATHSAEARAKMSAAKRGRPGHKPSAETRAKLSAIARNRKRGQNARFITI